MPHQDTVFHHLIKVAPRAQFERLTQASGVRARRLGCWTQLLALVYAQLAGLPALRALVRALACQQARLAPLGLAPVRRSTLAEANATRQALLAPVAGLLEHLIGRLQQAPLAGPALGLVRLLDATVLPLPAAACRWARFCDRVAGVKLHLVYDPALGAPTYFAITPQRVADIVPARALPLEAGASYVFDLGYYAFDLFAAIAQAGGRFVTRLKASSPVHELAVLPLPPAGDGAPDGAPGAVILSDRLVGLNARLAASRRNPCAGLALREVVVARAPGRPLRLLTNDVQAPATEIARLYRARWEIEILFRWLKQTLTLTRFLGTSETAVKLQILAALLAHLLLRLAQARLPSPLSLSHLASLVRLSLTQRQSLDSLAPQPPPQRHSPAAKPSSQTVC